VDIFIRAFVFLSIRTVRVVGQRLCARLGYCVSLAPLLRPRSCATGSPGWRPTKTLSLSCKAKCTRVNRSRCATLTPWHVGLLRLLPRLGPRRGGFNGVGYLQWPTKNLGYFTCPCYSLQSDWNAIVEVFYPDGSWNLPTSICLVNAWSSTRTQARSRQVTAATCATQRPQPSNPRTRDSPTKPHHILSPDHRRGTPMTD